METVRERLVRGAAQWDVVKVHQLEGWVSVSYGGHPYLLPDEDGDGIGCMENYELWAGPQGLPVRVHVVAGTEPDVVVRLLRKMAQWLETAPEIIRERPIEPWEEEEAKVVAALAGIVIEAADCARLLRVIDETKQVSRGERAAWVKVDPRDIGDGPIEPWEAEDAATFATLAGVAVQVPECVRLLRLATAARPLRWTASDGVTRRLDWGS